MKEATARIKINRLLEDAGWRFFAEDDKLANIQLEPSVTLLSHELERLGENFEHSKKGFIDFLLLDNRGRPLIVLEAKPEDKSPLVGKEQARKYARAQNCRFVILSNGNLHYFWDLERGSPYQITAFPTPESTFGYKQTNPDSKSLTNYHVANDFVALTQMPNYQSDASWINEQERSEFVRTNKLRFLRPYQLNAVHSLQRAVRDGKDRFLFEMATGTGKTLTSAAIIKLFLKSRNANRVLFLVDRLELEDQARKDLVAYLSNDFTTVVYKEKREEWRSADIVVTTVQSLLFNNKYQQQFSPTDFDLVISDEAHRSIGGNARAVFEYFVGYKLGLTATPKDYLRNFDSTNPTTHDPRESERRLLQDTYKTFGCDSGEPTFRYSLVDGVREGYLINPTVVDARTDITTKLLSEQGFVVESTEDGVEYSEAFGIRDFEKEFFAEHTNIVMCQTFLQHALRDPISGEIGKSIAFAVSQNHAARLTQILNQLADAMFPGKYQSDFAVQVTSSVQDAQRFTINFRNNNLMGSANFIPDYRTSKARVCVTVGMMTTGYDCTDILNIGLFRPIFSPTDFIQIKGRGTRNHDFHELLQNPTMQDHAGEQVKSTFKLFDFFANCEYFEEEFNYDEVLKLPRIVVGSTDFRDPGPTVIDIYEHLGEDAIARLIEEAVGYDGMRIDRMYFQKFEDQVRDDQDLTEAVHAGQWDHVIDHVERRVFNQPDEFFTLDKLRKAAPVDRRIGLREILEKVFGLIPGFKSMDELLEEEFSKFIASEHPDSDDATNIAAIRHFFNAYVTSDKVRGIIEQKTFTELNTNPGFTSKDFKAVPVRYLRMVPEYVKDYVSLNRFMSN